ncbi:MAG: hypothetical protein H6Q65_1205 [Firmicutes bacterium]|nr:hypothetical protein [Bacillota bacterium]
MKDIINSILAIVLVVAVLLGITWVIQGNAFFLYKVFAPATEQVRRETFEESKAYNQGVAQDISNFQQQYAQATDNQKDALASIIIHRYADYDLSKLQPDQRSFIEKLRRGVR